MATKGNCFLMRSTSRKARYTEVGTPLAIEVTDLDLAYAAGIFDGEGFVGLTINRQPTHRRVNMTYNLTVSIANTNLPLIAWLKDSFGGYISTRQYRKDEYPDRLLGYEWKIVARQADERLAYLIQRSFVDDYGRRY